MWIFAPFGLLMPSEFPADKVDPKYVPEGSDYDLQIRARAVSHLENFVRDYAEPMGLSYSEIQLTPEMDYNARLYMSREDFAAAVSQMVMGIDFKKFKPTAEDKNADGTLRYKEGVAYHSVLNSIWGTLTRLGKPGGMWALGGKNTGYRPFSGPTQSRSLWDLEDAQDFRDYDESETFSGYPGMWTEDEYETASSRRKNAILADMEGIPARQWEDELTGEELAIVWEEHEEALAAESRRNKPKGHRRSWRGRKRSRV